MNQRLMVEIDELLKDSIHQPFDLICSLLKKYRESPYLPFVLVEKICHFSLSETILYIDYILTLIPYQTFRLTLAKFEKITEKYPDNSSHAEKFQFIKLILEYYNQASISILETKMEQLSDLPENLRMILKWLSAKWYRKIHDYISSRIILRALNEKFPDNPVIWYEQGLTELEHYHVQTSLNFGKKVINKHPSLIWGYLLSVKSLILAQLYDEGLELCKYCSDNQIINSELLKLKADLLSLKNFSAQSLKTYQDAIDFNHYNLTIWKNLGSTLIDYEDYEEVKDIIRIIFDYDNASPLSFLMTAWYLEAQHEYDNAIHALLEGKKKVPNPGDLYLELAKCYALLKDDFNQYMYLQKVIELFPEDFHVKILLGNYYLNHDDEEGAKSLYNELLQIDPSYIPAKFGLIRIFIHTAEDRALIYRKINEIITDAPYHFDALFLKAELLFQDKKFDQSKHIFTLCLTRYPNNPQILHYLGLIQILFHQNYQEALELLRSALETNPQNLQVGLDLIRLHLYYLNEPENAMRIIEQLWSLHEESTELKELFKETQQQLEKL